MKPVFSILGLCFASLWLASCTLPLLQGDSGATALLHTYILEWTPPGAPHKPASDAPSLLISPPRAGPGYTGSDMIYVKEAHELDRFAYHRWADSPARMLEPLLLAALEHSGQFRQVIPAGSNALADLRLDTRLLYLRQVFDQNGCHVEFGVRIDLFRISSGRALGGRELGYREACDAATPQGGVRAANRAVGHFLDELGPALSTLMARD